jgi:hypothetical protein
MAFEFITILFNPHFLSFSFSNPNLDLCQLLDQLLDDLSIVDVLLQIAHNNPIRGQLLIQPLQQELVNLLHFLVFPRLNCYCAQALALKIVYVCDGAGEGAEFVHFILVFLGFFYFSRLRYPFFLCLLLFPSKNNFIKFV